MIHGGNAMRKAIYKQAREDAVVPLLFGNNRGKIIVISWPLECTTRAPLLAPLFLFAPFCRFVNLIPILAGLLTMTPPTQLSWSVWSRDFMPPRRLESKWTNCCVHFGSCNLKLVPPLVGSRLPFFDRNRFGGGGRRPSLAERQKIR